MDKGTEYSLSKEDKKEYISSRTKEEEDELLTKIKTLKELQDPNKIGVKIKKLHPDAKLPTKGSDNAGAWDVYCTDVEEKEKGLWICKLGFALEFSPNYRVMLQPRSSITKTEFVQQNSPGLGDADYRGEYQFRFRKLGWKPSKAKGAVIPDPAAPFKRGDRVGQLYFERIIDVDWEETVSLGTTDRGDGGFGSTGK